jgi:peptidoglycan/xylan/chitin deacetylase (PgdA/CDA1 family)
MSANHDKVTDSPRKHGMGLPAPRLSILIYHRVRQAPDPLLPGAMFARKFDAQLSLLRRFFTVLPLDEALARLGSGTLPRRAVSITFDDGYADNFEVAVPVLRQHKSSATFFVSTGYLDGGLMWNDVVIEAIRRCPEDRIDLNALGLGTHRLSNDGERRTAMLDIIDRLKYVPVAGRAAKASELAARIDRPLPSNLMMRTEQVAALGKAGMGIGAHTVSHPILTQVDDATARREIEDSRSALQGITGSRIEFFAYPNGRPGDDYSQVHVSMVREAGFEAALSTAKGSATAADDRFQLPRFTPWAQTPLRFLAQLVRSRWTGRGRMATPSLVQR